MHSAGVQATILESPSSRQARIGHLGSFNVPFPYSYLVEVCIVEVFLGWVPVGLALGSSHCWDETQLGQKGSCTTSTPMLLFLERLFGSTSLT